LGIGNDFCKDWGFERIEKREKKNKKLEFLNHKDSMYIKS
jgi:hypothetical protein